MAVAMRWAGVGAGVGDGLGRRYGLQLDAERAYVGMVGHLEECAAYDRAGGELARREALCPAGRRARDAWERTERRLIAGRADHAGSVLHQRRRLGQSAHSPHRPYPPSKDEPVDALRRPRRHRAAKRDSAVSVLGRRHPLSRRPS